MPTCRRPVYDRVACVKFADLTQGLTIIALCRCPNKNSASPQHGCKTRTSDRR